MALIPTQPLVAAGTKPTFAACAAGDTARCGPGRFLVVKNADSGSHTVTMPVPGKQAGGADNDAVVFTVAATTGEVWIPLGDQFVDPTDGLAHPAYSATTSMTRAAVLAI